MSEDLAEKLSQEGWEVRTTSSESARWKKLLDMVRTTLTYRKVFDIVHIDVFSGPAFIWAEVICGLLKFLRKPFVLTLHGGGLPLFARKHDRRVSRLLKAASAVTTPSEYLREKMCLYRSDIQLIENPIDLALYDFQRRKKPTPNLIWLRAFHKIYNPGMALQVLSDLRGDYPEISLRMIGPDKQDGSLEKLQEDILRHGLKKHVELIRGVPKKEVPAYLNSGDIFINTTNVDNTPVSVVEAMACGLCIVSTNVGGIPYLLTDEVDSLLCPPGDAAAMADGIRRYLADPDFASSSSLNARDRAEQFGWGVVLPKWTRLFEGIIR